jgi:hypothetical protein
MRCCNSNHQKLEELMRRFDNKLDNLGSAFVEASGNTGGQQARQATAAAFQL